MAPARRMRSTGPVSRTCVGGGEGIRTPGFLRARENPGARMTCDAAREALLACGVGRPLVPGVVRDSPVACGPDVALAVPSGRRRRSAFPLLGPRDQWAGQAEADLCPGIHELGRHCRGKGAAPAPMPSGQVRPCSCPRATPLPSSPLPTLFSSLHPSPIRHRARRPCRSEARRRSDRAWSLSAGLVCPRTSRVRG